MGAGDDYLAGLQSGAGVTIHFKEGKIEDLGEDLGEQAPGVQTMARNTGGIRVEPPAFGVVGIGLNYAHDRTKDGAAGALDMARTALEDYRTALAKLDKNYQKADKDNDGIIKVDSGGDGGDIGAGSGFDPSAYKMPKTPMPDAGGLGKTDVPTMPTAELPRTDLPSSDVPNTDPPTSNVPPPNIADPSVQNPDISQPNVPSIEDQLNHNVPALDPNSLPADPGKTDLASFDPSALGTPATPNATTSVGPGMSTGGPSGGAAGAAPAAASAAGPRGGMNGMNGMPFMPMMGGTGGEQDRERDKPEYVRGDEDDWLDDIDIAPPVIGE
ncbi:hypothetical protein ACFLIM_09545 [Nonomuraea sp. M3C6]|uniref:EF-hand domain-containing protein n=1 Tax=Nonomuraea marmarensis TaxID=3351344 RepID=A0ABW7A7V2_9ACTN